MEHADGPRLTDEIHPEPGMGDPVAAAMRAAQPAMIVTDPRRLDNPIVFANDAFLRLTGYARAEVTGRNCRFLQGPETDGDAVARLRAAIRGETGIDVDLLNYRKDGSTFHNALHLSPVRDESGELALFVAWLSDVSDRYRILRDHERANEALAAALDAKTRLVRNIDHRVKNNLQMIAATIVLQSRHVPEPETRRVLTQTLERIEALSTVHRRLHLSEDVSRFDVAEFMRDLVTDLVGAMSRTDIAVAFDLDAVSVRADTSAALALLLNEVLSHALAHGFAGNRPGTLAVRIAGEEGNLVVTIEDDGAGTAEPEASSFAHRLIRTLTRQLGADISWEAREPRGTRVAIRLPAAPLTDTN